MKFVEVYRAADQQQAYLLRNLLVDEGIEAFVSGETLSAATDLQGWDVYPRVLVSEKFAELALPLVREFDESTKSQLEVIPDEFDEDEFDRQAIEALNSWPRCWNCAQMKHVSCPSCRTKGRNFDLAEFIQNEVGDTDEVELVPGKLKLVCQLCDSIFEPVFDLPCPCGHVESTKSGEEARREHKNPAADWLALMVALIVMGVIVMAAFYFWSIR